MLFKWEIANPGKAGKFPSRCFPLNDPLLLRRGVIPTVKQELLVLEEHFLEMIKQTREQPSWVRCAGQQLLQQLLQEIQELGSVKVRHVYYMVLFTDVSV